MGSCMRSREFEQREYDCFISYASEDREIAERLKKFLEMAGLKAFLDVHNFPAGNEVVEGLATKMAESKACLALVSSGSFEKKYFREEIRLAGNEAVVHEEFRFVVAIMDQKVNPAQHFNSLKVRSWLALPNGELTVGTARDLVLALRTRGSLPQSSQPHVYVSCSWKDREIHPRDAVLAEMKTQGAFLVGDALDQKDFQEEGAARITRIMSGCAGFVGVYPDRQDRHKSADELNKYFLDELKIADRLGLVKSLFCARTDSLPAAMQKQPINEWKEGESYPALRDQVSDFLEEVGTKHPHTFLATDFKQSLERNRAAKDIMEYLMGMHCRLGREVMGNELREQLRCLIEEANLVVADIACSFHGETPNLKINVNTCVEAGIAFAHKKPLFITSLDANIRDPNAKKSDAIPFFFRNHVIEWYRSEPEFLASIHKIALNRRRRVINDELP